MRAVVWVFLGMILGIGCLKLWEIGWANELIAAVIGAVLGGVVVGKAVAIELSESRGGYKR